MAVRIFSNLCLAKIESAPSAEHIAGECHRLNLEINRSSSVAFDPCKLAETCEMGFGQNFP